MTKPCSSHNLTGCLACANRSYAEQLPRCQCEERHSGGLPKLGCGKTARFSVVRNGKRIYVCEGCTFQGDTDREDLFEREPDMSVPEDAA